MAFRSQISLVLLLALSASQAWASITIDSYNFDLAQFTGAAVTYSEGPGHNVTFDGKRWDQAAGVDGFTTGELAAVQAGGDPGDQLSFNSTNPLDWFQLTYGGPGLIIGGPGNNTFVIYEITSPSGPSNTPTGIDPEGTNWTISFNGNTPIDAASGATKWLKFDDVPADGGFAENVNQIAFDLSLFGFSPGDVLSTVRIENKSTGPSGATDPDFIFTALESTPGVVPELTSFAVWSVLGLVTFAGSRRRSS
ncbi:hypothetical protein Pr1d_33720 [Bythopirellula goksoeyrii]|uniref:PEP-CTERM protein-sorting domain-containing protein n=2 Tax=Bythopirellula goksoeyrii TaxID=1400387 RepID=A0A5B9QQ18_9BACT|nr:hypothetical protein Pr1d_33720 [Bythopirellula goksoeyrii]